MKTDRCIQTVGKARLLEMRKSKWWLVALTAILAVAAGCGRETDDAAEDTGSAEEYIYVPEYFSLNKDGMMVGSTAVDADGTVFFSGSKEEKQGLYSVQSGEDAIAEIPVELGENETISAININGDGNIIMGNTTYQGENETDSTITKIEIKTIDGNGAVVKAVDTGNIFLNNPEFYIQKILQDKDGNYYLCTGNSIYVLNEDGQLICEISPGYYIDNMFSMKDGRVCIGAYGDTGFKLEEIDLQQKGLKELESAVYFDYGMYQGGTETDLVYTMNSKLYTCNLTDEKPTEILDWVDCDINSNNVNNVVMLEDGKIAAVSNDWSSTENAAELAVLTRKKRSEVPEKKVLTYGTLYLPYYTSKDIVDFNKQSEEYRIEVKQYGDDNTDYETKASLFTADISSGKGPDIIDLSSAPVSFGEMVSMGILEDLAPYLDSDEEIKRENYHENVIKAYETDGKLYGIIPFFGVKTLVGKLSDVGEGSSWTVDELIALADSKDKDAEIIPYVTKPAALQLMLTINADMFVNEETGECNFTGGEFLKILEFANRFPNDMEYDANAPSEIEKIRNNKLILVESLITSVKLYQMYEYEFGEEVNYIGYPTVGKSGSVIEPNGTIAAMNTSSPNKDGVWKFLSFNLTQERQENTTMADEAFPIMKSALDKSFEEDMKAEYYEDADGNKKEKPKGTWGNMDYSVEVFAARQDQVDKVRQLIDTAECGQNSDRKMFGLIYEEVQAYFEGQRSAEDVAALIQNRVQTYINETR